MGVVPRMWRFCRVITQRTAHGIDRLQWVDIGKAGHPRYLLIQARVVLHGAAAQGIHAVVGVDAGEEVLDPRVQERRGDAATQPRRMIGPRRTRPLMINQPCPLSR